MAVTTPANGAVTTDWAILPWSAAMAASSCWMAAWVAATCSAVAGALPAVRVACAVVTAAAAWATPAWLVVNCACWSAWACASASWSEVRLPWSTWTWRWSDPQVAGGVADVHSGMSSWYAC